MVDRQTFDDPAERGDELRRLTDVHNGGDNVFVVLLLVKFIAVGVEQLFQNVGIVLRKRLAHFGAGIPGTDRTAELNQPVERYAVPLVQIGNLRLQLFKLLFRVIDQRCELVQFRVGDAVLEQQIKPLADHAGAGIENVEKGLVLPMNIRDKVLAALRQIQNRLKVDDLRPGGAQSGVLP